MKIKDKRELHEKSIEELKNLIRSTEKELVTARLDHLRGQLKNSSTLTILRKKIAQMLTIIREKEFASYGKNA